MEEALCASLLESPQASAARGSASEGPEPTLDVPSNASQSLPAESDAETLAMHPMAKGTGFGGFWGVAVPPAPEEGFMCQYCKRPLEPFQPGVRLISKTKGGMRYQCGNCNRKTVSLSNMFGGWPIDEFRAIPERAQTEFWQSCGDAANAHALKQIVERLIIRRTVTQIMNGKEGSFNTLGFYKRQGYDTDHIEKTCDHEWNPDLGEMTYRVRLHVVSEKTIQEGVQEHMLKLLSRAKRGAPKARGDSAPPMKKARVTRTVPEEEIEEGEEQEGDEDGEEEEEDEEVGDDPYATQAAI